MKNEIARIDTRCNMGIKSLHWDSYLTTFVGEIEFHAIDWCFLCYNNAIMHSSSRPMGSQGRMLNYFYFKLVRCHSMSLFFFWSQKYNSIGIKHSWKYLKKYNLDTSYPFSLIRFIIFFFLQFFLEKAQFVCWACQRGFGCL